MSGWSGALHSTSRGKPASAIGRKGQASLELVMLLAAYAAFIAVFASGLKGAFAESASVSKNVSRQAALENACFTILFFSLDGGRTVMRGGTAGFDGFPDGFSSNGSTLRYGGSSLECNASFRLEDGLKVETSAAGMEYR